MKLPDKVYDVLKWLALVALNALGWAYEELANIWNWPCGTEINKTLVRLSTLIGILIGISTAEYRKSLADKNLEDLLHDTLENTNQDIESPSDEHMEETEDTYEYYKN